MVDKPSDFAQGTLDMLILKTLALEPMPDMDGRPARTDELGRFPVECRLSVLSPFGGSNEMG
jgi:hypothetical protein